jgi:hypothetical protein
MSVRDFEVEVQGLGFCVQGLGCWGKGFKLKQGLIGFRV